MTAPAPRRPVLRWHGGKWRLAPWILSHFPAHRIYVEPFGGAGSVLLRKPRSYAEVYNDLDDEVVTLFRVLQNPIQAARLDQLLQLTPFARAEFQRSYETSDDTIEQSRRLIIRAFMGFGSNAHASSPVAAKNGFKTHTRAASRSTGFRANSSRGGSTPAGDWANYSDCIEAFTGRMRGVIIEHRDAALVMAQHDGPDTLHYADPPYMHETRAPSNKYDLKYRMYRHEIDDAGHARLLGVLRGLKGMVAVSGYPSPLYDAALADWRRVHRAAFADGAAPRTEVLWLNPAAIKALGAEQMPLFAGGAA